MKGFGNDSQSIAKCAAKASLWNFHPLSAPFLLLMPEHIQPFQIKSLSRLWVLQVREKDEENEGRGDTNSALGVMAGPFLLSLTYTTQRLFSPAQLQWFPLFIYAPLFDKRSEWFQ